jgi:excisionase family DNA binding protein
MPCPPPPTGSKPSPLGTELYTTAEVAALLRCSARHLLRAIDRGELQAVKTGRHYVMTAEAVRAYWAQLAAGTRTSGSRPASEAPGPASAAAPGQGSRTRAPGARARSSRRSQA